MEQCLTENGEWLEHSAQATVFQIQRWLICTSHCMHALRERLFSVYLLYSQVHLAQWHFWQLWRWPSTNSVAHLFPPSDPGPDRELRDRGLKTRHVRSQLKTHGAELRNPWVTAHGAVLSSSCETHTCGKLEHWILNCYPTEKNSIWSNIFHICGNC